MRIALALLASVLPAAGLAGSLFVPSTEQSCLAVGGKWGLHGSTESLAGFCVVQTTDGGKACESSVQCQGTCLALPNAREGSRGEGRCSGSTYPASCFTAVEKRRVQRRVCE